MSVCMCISMFTLVLVRPESDECPGCRVTDASKSPNMGFGNELGASARTVGEVN